MIRRAVPPADAPGVPEGLLYVFFCRIDGVVHALSGGQARCNRRGKGAARPVGIPGRDALRLKLVKTPAVVKNVYGGPAQMAPFDHHVPGCRVHE